MKNIWPVTVLIIICITAIGDLAAQTPRQGYKSDRQAGYIRNWQAEIDSTWGEGLPVGIELSIFDTVWTAIDEKFACFQNLDVDWAEVRSRYRPEIERGVSRGRFAAIMNHMARALKETHTIFLDSLVNLATKPEPGVPLLFVGGWGDNGHFGAGLTPRSDSSLLVYKAVARHPLGLVPGDIVLGFEGIPWKDLYEQLIQAELPITFTSQGVFRWGSNEKSYRHSWLMSAGMNWHLFDTIDIVKYESGDTLHLPTDLLAVSDMSLYCTEQLPVPGIPMPDVEKNRYLSCGLIEGTNIGYLNLWSWSPDKGITSLRFYNAVDSLINIFKADALILDFRNNPGGYLMTGGRGLDLLFDEESQAIGFAVRDNPDDHFQMRTSGSNLHVPSSPNTVYDKPIAVLTGPGGLSATDFAAFWLQGHPNARLFGKTTCGAFSSPVSMNLSDNGLYVSYAASNGFVWEDYSRFLTHTEIEIDEPLWLSDEDVYQGVDTVVEAAMAWIESMNSYVGQHLAQEPSTFRLLQNYPNPFNSSTTIEFSIQTTALTTLKIFNVDGQELATLASREFPAGNHRITWDASGKASGVYFYRLQTDNFVQTKKMIVVK